MFEPQIVADFFRDFPPEVATSIIAMTPVFELRASLPIAIMIYDMSLASAYFWSIVGNIIPIIAIIFLLDSVSAWLSERFEFWDKIFTWLFERTRRKAKDKIEKYGLWGLFFLVAIPLPMTGGWTGAMAAFLFGIERKKAIPIIFLGIVVAGIIVMLITIGAIKI